ncbi:MAG: proline dehydrogenase family protein [Bacteroidia bacterium]|nr:proline dehydrogenase family protein [Bacteroidia bacterium]MDW8236487.1 proline dehydrogenase family protein [Bacteroidia bacterium]
MSILHVATGVNLDDTEVGYAYRSTEELRQAYWLFYLLRSGALVRAANFLGGKALQWGLPFTETILQNTLGKLFLGGTSLEESVPVLRRLHGYGISVMLDYAVEASQTIAQADSALKEYYHMIDFAQAHREEVAFLAIKLTALAPPLLWEKLSRKEALSPSLQRAYDHFQAIFPPLIEKAAAAQIPIMIDAEESWIQAAIDETAEHFMQRYNKEAVLIYTTVQMYRRDRLEYLKELLQRAQGHKVGIKLVRGAYVEKERRYAESRGLPDPIHPTKNATDLAYDLALMHCLEHIDRVSVCIATHNRQSCMKAVQYAILQGWDFRHPHLSFSQLYGMSDPLSFGLAKAGFRVAKYLPYGPLKQAFPYLSRRAEENSSLSDQSGRELGWIEEELRRRKRAKKA